LALKSSLRILLYDIAQQTYWQINLKKFAL
jgi:hypothetical protein